MSFHVKLLAISSFILVLLAANCSALMCYAQNTDKGGNISPFHQKFTIEKGSCYVRYHKGAPLAAYYTLVENEAHCESVFNSLTCFCNTGLFYSNFVRKI